MDKDPRRGRRWIAVKQAAHRRDSQAVTRYADGTVEVGARCWICGGRIDYAAKPQTPFAYEPDHVEPVERRPDLAYELSNIRPSHCKCNRSRGDGTVHVGKKKGLGKPSRDWFKKPGQTHG